VLAFSYNSLEDVTQRYTKRRVEYTSYLPKFKKIYANI
jgi:hypothetical protein